MDGKERVNLVARHDGCFSIKSEGFSDVPHELCWMPGDAGGIYGSEEIGVREIYAAFPRVRRVLREERLNS
jgi:hypothetical protein